MKDVVDFKASNLGGEFGDMLEMLRFKEGMNYDVLDIFDATENKFTFVVYCCMKIAMIDNDVKEIDFCDLDFVILNSEEDVSQRILGYLPV